MFSKFRLSAHIVVAAIPVSVTMRRLQNNVAICSPDVLQSEPFSAPIPKISLYQYKICPFCHRVKACLDFLKIDYETTEVNPLTKSELSFSKEYKKVPVAVIDGELIGDSALIMEKLVKTLPPDVQAKFSTIDTPQWTEWSEKKLAVLLYPNITRTWSESWECFGYTSSITQWSLPEQLITRVAGTFFMSLANGKIKKKYDIVDERAELKAVLAEWTGAVNGKKFLHGETPTMPDLMVFGVLKSISGFQTFNEIMEDSLLREWYGRVESAVDAPPV